MQIGETVAADEEPESETDENDGEAEDDDFDEDVKYNSSEIIITKKCVELIDSSLDIFKFFLQCMPLYKDDISNMEVIKSSLERIQDLVEEVGSELYSPIDVPSLQTLSSVLFEENRNFVQLLAREDTISVSTVFTSSGVDTITAFISANDPWNLNTVLFDHISVCLHITFTQSKHATCKSFVNLFSFSLLPRSF